MKYYQSFFTIAIGICTVLMHNFAEMDCIKGNLINDLCQFLPIFWVIGYFLLFSGLVIFALEWKIYENIKKKSNKSTQVAGER